MAERTEERRNRFTGKVAVLTKEEADIHDQVFVCEALGKFKDMQKNLDKFPSHDRLASMRDARRASHYI